MPQPPKTDTGRQPIPGGQRWFVGDSYYHREDGPAFIASELGVTHAQWIFENRVTLDLRGDIQWSRNA